jgi:hypothetical protein
MEGFEEAEELEQQQQQIGDGDDSTHGADEGGHSGAHEDADGDFDEPQQEDHPHNEGFGDDADSERGNCDGTQRQRQQKEQVQVQATNAEMCSFGSFSDVVAQYIPAAATLRGAGGVAGGRILGGCSSSGNCGVSGGGSSGAVRRVVLHIDCDAFYTQVRTARGLYG